MGTFFDFAFTGVPYGCDFAILAVGLVLTYRATGVFNLAFGAQAYLSALVFYVLVRSSHLPVWAAALVAILGLSPAVGIFLDRALFRLLPPGATVGKLVLSVGILIAIPNITSIVFGPATRLSPPSLVFNLNEVYFHVGSVPVNGLELGPAVVTVLVVLVLLALLRWSSIGLRMRAVVESRRLAQMEGVNASGVSSFAWGLSSVLAGLAGVLLAPLDASLHSSDYTSLVVSAMAVAVFGLLRSLPRALAGGVILGVIQTIVAGYLPSNSTLSGGIQAALPFLLLAALLVGVPSMRRLEESQDPLSVCDPPAPPLAAAVRDRRLERPMRVGFWLLVVAFLVSSATWIPGDWVYELGIGLSLSVVFLSYTLITGMAGQISLCQATFAGVGCFFAGQLAIRLGFPMLAGIAIGGAAAAVVGVVVAVPALRLGRLPLALLTLAFALVADNLIFPYSWAGGGASGLFLPEIRVGSMNLSNPRPFVFLSCVVLAICAIAVLLVQRGHLGRALAAIRGSEIASVSLGLNVNRAKIVVFALAAAMAGIGGVLYGAVQQAVSPNDFVYEYSLVFVVVVITTGATTVEGAIQAGMAYAIIAQVLTYVPQRLDGLEPILFAIGTVTYAAHPEGIVEYQRRIWMQRVGRLLARWDQQRAGGPGPRSGEAPRGEHAGQERSPAIAPGEAAPIILGTDS